MSVSAASAHAASCSQRELHLIATQTCSECIVGHSENIPNGRSPKFAPVKSASRHLTYNAHLTEVAAPSPVLGDKSLRETFRISAGGGMFAAHAIG